jgi:hypothetical protein
MSADDYDALQDTIAVLADSHLVAAHRQGQAAIAAGNYLDGEQLAAAMEDVGRRPR